MPSTHDPQEYPNEEWSNGLLHVEFLVSEPLGYGANGDGGDWKLDFLPLHPMSGVDHKNGVNQNNTNNANDDYKNNFFSTEHVLKDCGGGIKLGPKLVQSQAQSQPRSSKTGENSSSAVSGTNNNNGSNNNNNNNNNDQPNDDEDGSKTSTVWQVLKCWLPCGVLIQEEDDDSDNESYKSYHSSRSQVSNHSRSPRSQSPHNSSHVQPQPSSQPPSRGSLVNNNANASAYSRTSASKLIKATKSARDMAVLASTAVDQTESGPASATRAYRRDRSIERSQNRSQDRSQERSQGDGDASATSSRQRSGSLQSRGGGGGGGGGGAGGGPGGSSGGSPITNNNNNNNNNNSKRNQRKGFGLLPNNANPTPSTALKNPSSPQNSFYRQMKNESNKIGSMLTSFRRNESSFRAGAGGGANRGEENRNSYRDGYSGLSSNDKSSLSSHHFGLNHSSSNPSSGQDDSDSPQQHQRRNNNNHNNHNNRNKTDRNRSAATSLAKESSANNIIGAIKVGQHHIINHNIFFYFFFFFFNAALDGHAPY